MKRMILTTLTLLALCGAVLAQAKRTQPQPLPTPQATPPDESKMIEKLIKDYAKAMSDFPRSGDAETVLKFYAPSYSEITDGEERTRSEVKLSWEEQGERINLGSADRRTISVDQVGTPKVFGTLAYVTFSFTEKIGRDGRVMATYNGTCTEILSKANGDWLLEHEHCSRTLRR